ncbi:chemotaxis protein CheA [Marinobacter bohaiensis]|uniref:chemotaxis protein CheA n=1 Tax=Marinobacter bohaiensis TaxID=2201898 RepID=UPI000DAED96F|nr:chemotaxis protein CheA [Marinobacter bohaiensis]
MALDADEEILQDFLIEAGEILEKLSEQLVDLEQQPDNSDLLNAIFRGFHTVKGGAGFLQLEALVNCCHSAENVFDTLRNHKRQVTSDLMDVVLEALDNVNAMFDQVRNREEPTPADPALIAALDALAEPEGAAPKAAEPPAEDRQPAPTESDPAGGADQGDITDDEFEQLLDALEGEKSESGDADQDDEISDDEFENLLDELHGKGKHGGTPADAAKSNESAAAADDEISDDEFENLLDELHGKGQFKGAAGASPDTPAGKAPEAAAGGDDKITDDEFESLLDELHGKGKGPATGPAQKPAAASTQGAGDNKPAADDKKAPASPAVPQRDAQPTAEASVRVDTKRLDDIMNMVGELVLVRNRLQRLGDQSENTEMHKAVSNLDVVTADLQSAVMATRMQPIKKVFGRFPRVVRDLARSLKKEIDLVMHGEDTDLDKNLVEALADPLVHLVRNSVDHGIEAPDVRENAGKPRKGKVTLSAEQEGDHILLVIEDDGAGMDPDKLRQKAVEKGIYEQEAADRLTNSECYNLIFAPGFSTKDQISDVSGRGVGMDVVKTKISQLNGTIGIESELGKGSRIIIKVPLTLAIMPTLMIMLGDQSFALPLVNVVEIFHLDLTKKNIVDGRECIVVRDKVFPLYKIKNWLVHGAAGEPEPENAHVVIVAMGTRQVGFVVDQLIGQEEVVIKPLGRMLHGTPGMAGATITGDGRIALIIDVPSLLQHYG